MLEHDITVRTTLLEHGESSTDGGIDIGRLQILIGQDGGGKSHTINSIIATLENDHGFTGEDYNICGITGKASSLIGGSTLHSHKEVFGLPCRKAIPPV
eukprot:1345913-Ditylum_brightwellii.AAC.1